MSYPLPPAPIHYPCPGPQPLPPSNPRPPSTLTPPEGGLGVRVSKGGSKGAAGLGLGWGLG